MLHNRLALHRDMVDAYLQTSREAWDAARTMSRAERHEAVEEIYAAAQINTVDRGREEGFYTVNDDGVAQIQIVGFLTPTASPCAALFGDAETEYGFIQEAIEQASADPSVASLELYVDSPGGYVDGVDETAMAIAGASKPTVARVHNMAASAAYWLASQADRIIASSPADVVGSIGVAVEVLDFTERDAAMGVKHLTFTSTDAPDKRLDLLSDEGAEKLVAELDDLHAVFARRVADGRGVTVEKVNSDFGRGGIVIADKAMASGMIDEVLDVQKKQTERVVDVSEPAAKAEPKKEGVMNVKTLQTEHPEVFAEAVQIGVTQERERIAQLDDAAASDPDNAKLGEIVKEAKAGGKTLADVQTRVNVAIRDFKRDAEETPPAVATAQHDTASGETDGRQDADDQVKTGVAAVLAAAGYSEEVKAHG